MTCWDDSPSNVTLIFIFVRKFVSHLCTGPLIPYWSNYTARKESLGGLYRFHPVCLSVRLSVHIEGTWFVRATPPTVFLLGSFYFADHLYIYQRCACGKDFDFCAFLPKI